MKKLLLSILLFPLALLAQNTNKVDNLWIPSTGSARFSQGTPGNGKVWTSDAVGIGSWTTPAASSGSGISNFFTANRTVFVDPNVPQYTNENVIGYTTLAEAVTAWRSGGRAQTKFGTPVATNMGVIAISPGIHNVTTNLILTDNLVVRGSGKYATIVKLTATSAQGMLSISNINTSLYDMTLDGDANVTSGGVVNLNYLSGSGYVGEMARLRILCTTANGIVATNGMYWNGKLLDSNLEIGGAANSGFYTTVATTPTQAEISRCTFIQTAAYGGARLSAAHTSAGPFILQNSIFLGTSQGNAAVVVDGGAYQIRNNYIENTDGGGYGLRSGASAAPRVTGNEFRTANNCVNTAGVGFYYDNKLRVIFGNNDAVVLAGGGSTWTHNRIIGIGTGRAIFASASNLIYFANNTMRRPTGDVQGSSVNTNVFNGMLSFTNAVVVPNQEVLAATTD